MSRLTQLLPELYSTVESPDRWTPVLDKLCAQMSAGNAVVQLMRRDGDRLCEIWGERDTESRQHAEAHDRLVNNPTNPRYDLRLMGWPPRPILLDEDWPRSRQGEIADLRARLAQIGLGASICLAFSLTDELELAIIMHRRLEDTREFDDADKGELQGLLPHLQQMAKLSTIIDDARARTRIFEQTANILRTGLLLCDLGGQVHWMNDSAERMIARSQSLRMIRGRLCGDVSGNSPSLRQLLMLGRGSVALEQRDPNFPGSLQLIVEPLGPPSSAFAIGNETLRAVIITEPEAPIEFDAEELSRLFGLSLAEGRLAAALAGGASVSSYSEGRGISIATARVQLRQILSKMNAERQSDLVRRLCNSAIAHRLAPLSRSETWLPQ